MSHKAPPHAGTSQPGAGSINSLEIETQGDSQHVSRSAGRATFGVLLSRLSGLARTPIVNAVFGAGAALDAFYTSFRFPNALRDLLADGALSAAFTKSLVEARQLGLHAERELSSKVTGLFLLMTGALSLFAGVWAKPFLDLVTNDKFAQGGSQDLAVPLFQILIFFLPLMMISSVCMAMLAARGQTFRAMFASSLANFGVICGALIAYPFARFFDVNAIFAMAWGMLGGGILQIAYQAVPLVREGALGFPCFNPVTLYGYKPLRNILLLMGPRFLGQGAFILALLINTNFATGLGQGIVTAITHAQVVILVPVGLFGVAGGLASLPVLTQLALSNQHLRFDTVLLESVKSAQWLALISLGFLCLCAVSVSTLLFDHGQGNMTSAMQTALAICSYGPAIYFSAGQKVLVQSFYALGFTRYIVINSFVYLGVNACLSWYLVGRFGLMGLGISNSIAACVDFLMYRYFLNKVTKRKLSFGHFGIQVVCVASFSVLGLLFLEKSAQWQSSIGPNRTIGSVVMLSIGSLIIGIFAIVVLKKFANPSLKKTFSRLPLLGHWISV